MQNGGSKRVWSEARWWRGVKQDELRGAGTGEEAASALSRLGTGTTIGGDVALDVTQKRNSNWNSGNDVLEVTPPRKPNLLPCCRETMSMEWSQMMMGCGTGWTVRSRNWRGDGEQYVRYFQCPLLKLNIKVQFGDMIRFRNVSAIAEITSCPVFLFISCTVYLLCPTQHNNHLCPWSQACCWWLFRHLIENSWWYSRLCLQQHCIVPISEETNTQWPYKSTH